MNKPEIDVAPAGEIDEFVDNAQEQCKAHKDLNRVESRAKSGDYLAMKLLQALSHLTALLKRCERLEEQNEGYGKLLGSANHDVEQLTKYAGDLQAENKQLKLSNICIPCSDDDCCGVLITKKFIDRPACNECGKVYVLVKENKNG